MTVQISRGSGNCIQIGNSDYPLNVFRALYGTQTLTLIPVKDNLILSSKLVYNYSQLVDKNDEPLGDDAETVRPKVQAILYSEDSTGE